MPPKRLRDEPQPFKHSPSLIPNLHSVLQNLSSNPYPEVQNPPNAEKRASVALVLRVQPNYLNWPSSSTEDPPLEDLSTGADTSSVESRLDAFFEQDWVKNGDPEVLFIKRAARKGDRWTSHVALPGGRRDPEDVDDEAAAVRETLEEVGIDLSEGQAISVGNLPQRVVTTSWGKVPLMVLCPYVFLLTQHDIPPMKLQPTEVGSTHWVSLRALLSPKQRTYEYQDVSVRLARQEMGMRRFMLRLMLGRMAFAAIRLIPTESLYASSTPEFVPESDSEPKSIIGTTAEYAKTWWRGGREASTSAPSEKPLMLWGLTLGVMADFLELLPPHTALELWTYPTFTPWDIRFALWAMSYSFRKQKQRELSLHGAGPGIASDERLDNGEVSVPETPAEPIDSSSKTPEIGIGGLGSGLPYDKLKKRQVSRNSATGTLLEGYYDIVRRATAAALVVRFSALIAIAVGLLAKYRKRRGVS